MKKIILLSLLSVFIQNIFAWSWPQCRNYNGSTPEQPATIYLGDNGNFGCDSWDMVDSKWPKWCVVISPNADLTTGGLTGSWSSYSNVQHKTNTSPRFTSTGTWYWGMKVEYTDAGGSTGWYCNNNTAWANMYGSPTSNLTISVSALSNPTSPTATATSSTQINLTWAKWNSKNIMIVRRLTSADPSNAPTQGSPYTVGNTLGTGTVIYNGGGTSFNDTGLTPGTGYTYTFYSENWSYYSSGSTASSTTTSTSTATDYFRSKTTGNWNDVGTWESSPNNSTWINATLVPDASATVTTILNTHTVTLTATAAAKTLTIASGGTLTCGGNILNIATSGLLTNNGNFTYGTGTVVFAGTGTIAGTISFNNVTLADGVIFSSSTTIYGTLTLNSGGYVNTSAPSYASGSILKYNSGTVYGRGTEWSATSGAGYPYNVQISNNTTVNIGANSGTGTARQCAGNLTVDAGSTFSMNITGNVMTSAVTIMGNILNNGTITLSGSIGGDLKSHGNIIDNGVFNANNRAVFFNGGNVQDISGAGTFDISYVRINKTAGKVRLVGTLESLASNGGNAIEIDGATSEFDLNGYALNTKSLVLLNSGKLTCGSSTVTIAAGGTIANGGTFTAGTGTVAFAGAATVTGTVAFNSVTLPSSATVDLGASSVAQPITGSSSASMSITGTGATGTINFDQTTPGTTNVLQNLTLNRASGSATLGGDLIVNNALTLTEGILELNGKTLTLGTSSTVSTTNGTLKGGGNSSISISGIGALGTLKFDQTTPGTTNVIKNLTINRTTGGTATIGNDLVISNNLQLTAGTITSSAGTKMTLLEGSKATTESGSSLTFVDLVFSKGTTTTSEFDNKGGSVAVTGKISVKVNFPDDAHWQFVSFPFAISAIKKSDGSTPIYNTDYGAVYYDATKRAAGQSGWIHVNEAPNAGVGYAFWSKSDLYFESSTTPTVNSFSSTTTKSLTYPSGGAITNAGWNFFAHPTTANAYGKLDLGEFHYSYNYLTDNYNVDEEINKTNQQSFDAYFIKTVAPRTMNFSTASMPASVRSSESTIIDKVTLNLVGATANYTTLVRVLPQSTGAYDQLYDAPYSPSMLSTTPQIYSFIGSNKFAINSVPEQSTVPVGIRVPMAGSYSFTWDAQLANLPVTLYDNLANKTTDLTSVSSYNFETTTSGEINNRFFINVTQKVISNVDNDKVKNPLNIYTQFGKVNIEGLSETSNVRIIDIVGKLLQTKTITSENSTFIVPNKGVYILEISNNTHKYKKKVIVQ
jgi:cytoskeletal protein CcmA (bactofilin family)